MPQRFYEPRHIGPLMLLGGLGLLALLYFFPQHSGKGHFASIILIALLPFVFAAAAFRILFPRKIFLELTEDALLRGTVFRVHRYAWKDCGPFTRRAGSFWARRPRNLIFSYGLPGTAPKSVPLGDLWQEDGRDLLALLNQYRAQALPKRPES